MDEAKEKAKEQYVKVCPKCQSIDIKSDLTLAFLGETSTNTCEDCGYTNNFFPEVGADKIDEFIENAKKATQ